MGKSIGDAMFGRREIYAKNAGKIPNLIKTQNKYLQIHGFTTLVPDFS